MKKEQIGLSLAGIVILLAGFFLGMLMPHSQSTVTFTDAQGERWTEVGDKTNGAEWRISPDADSMSVVHIYNNGKLSTWIGEPCNCY